MKKITVLSGKGGVGKSSISASLGVALSKDKRIICADCDIDASNLALALGLKREDYEEWNFLSTNEKAEFDPAKCTSCKKCVESCHFKAIGWENNKPKLKRFACEGCGVCELVCPAEAVKLVKVNNAKIGYGKTRYGFKVVSAQLEMGESGSGKVVAEVKKLAENISPDSEILLIDSAAGIGCPVIASITGSDYVIAVTEPTPSGFSDLKRALSTVDHFRIPCGIIINKFDLNEKETKKIEEFAINKGIGILTKIPYDRVFVKALVNLVPIFVYSPKYEKIFKNIADKIRNI